MSVPFGVLTFNNRPTAENKKLIMPAPLVGKKCGVTVLSEDLSPFHDLTCLTGSRFLY